MRWLMNMAHFKCFLYVVSMAALVGCALSTDGGGDIGTSNQQGSDFGTSNPRGSDFGTRNQQGSDFGTSNPRGSDIGTSNQQGSDFGTSNQRGSDFGTSNQPGSDFGTSNHQGSESSTSNPIDCEMYPSRLSGHQIVGELNGVLSGCILKYNPLMKRMSNVKGIEARRTFSRTLCKGLPSLNQCITEKSSKWQRCFTSNDRKKVFDIYFGVAQTFFRRGCAENGDSLAVILDGIDRHSADINERNRFVRECMLYGTSRWRVLLDSESNVATKVLLTHSEMHLFEDCLIDNIHGDVTFVAATRELLKDIRATMKCLHPENATLVLCKTIEDSLIDRTSVCPVRTSSEDLVPVSFKMDSIAEQCLYEHELFTPKLTDATSIDDYRIYLNVYCQLQDIVRGCFYETTLVASMCLHFTQYKTYKLVRDNLISAYNSGCFEEGSRLANVFYTTKMLKNVTQNNDALSTCLEDVKAARSNYKDDQARVYQYYKELTVFRNCVFERVNGGEQFVEDLNSLSDRLMAKMKCFNPQDGGIVLCETITSNRTDLI